MELRCACGSFRATLAKFPSNTPGRLICYCDDCQAYLRHLGRQELLDEHGGTEVVPAYPADVEFVSGQEHLRCLRMSAKGPYRFFTGCCTTPVANVMPGTPWAGFLRTVYDAGALDLALGPVRARIMGRFAKGTPPAGTAASFNLKAIASVLPFLLKGRLTGKASPSPFFQGRTPITTPHVLTDAEREAARG